MSKLVCRAAGSEGQPVTYTRSQVEREAEGSVATHDTSLTAGSFYLMTEEVRKARTGAVDHSQDRPDAFGSFTGVRRRECPPLSQFACLCEHNPLQRQHGLRLPSVAAGCQAAR